MAQREREEFLLQDVTPPVSHYTHAVRYGDLLFVSGLVGLDADTRVVSPDVVVQTRRIFEDMGRILAAAGGGFGDVLRVTVYLTDIADRTRINPVREEFFGDVRPASTLIEVKALVMPELKVEIEAIAGL